MKRCLSMFLLACLPLTIFSQNQSWIKFTWDGDSSGSRYFDKVAISVPIQIEDLPYKFSAQFDLGAINSMFYGNAIAPYIELNKILKDKIDTGATSWIRSRKYPTVKGVNLKLGNISFGKRDIALFSNFGDSMTFDSVKTNTVKQIGTIGLDLFQDKVLIIDYPNQRLCVANQVPREFAKRTSFVNCKLEDGRIKIPFQIAGKTEFLIFDTGSSLFSLYTSEKNAKNISNQNEAISDSIGGSTWGEFGYCYGRKTTKEIRLGNILLPSTFVYYDKKGNLEDILTNERVWGLTGNAYFINNILIIDCKKKQFGLCHLD